jgi:hypothetical protein
MKLEACCTGLWPVFADFTTLLSQKFFILNRGHLILSPPNVLPGHLIYSSPVARSLYPTGRREAVSAYRIVDCVFRGFHGFLNAAITQGHAGVRMTEE